jgi:ribosomal protein S18 acetylase RimI-like enzyme
MEEAEKYARRLALKSIRLNVLINNDLAKDVYHKLGFKDYSITLNKEIE